MFSDIPVVETFGWIMVCDNCNKRLAVIKHSKPVRYGGKWVMEVVTKDLCAPCYKEIIIAEIVPKMKYTYTRRKSHERAHEPNKRRR